MADIHFLLHKEKVRYHVYKRNLRNYQQKIIPYFKVRQLSSIKPMEIEAWQNRLLTKYNKLVIKNPFTQSEIDKLLDADDDTYIPNFIQLMSNCGARPGELIALDNQFIN